MQLSKTDFLHFLKCSKSLWLLKRHPELYPHRNISTYEDKLALEGYEVQRLVQEYLQSSDDNKRFCFEKAYKTKEGLYSVADIVRDNEDGTVNIYEVKSSGSIDKTHLIDAAFQTITAEN